MRLICVHGANSTKTSFNYMTPLLKELVPELSIEYFEYGIESDILFMQHDLVKMIGDGAALIGHSFGGLVALDAARRNKAVSHVITLATPLGGIDEAFVVGMLYPAFLFKNVIPGSNFLTTIERGKYHCEVDCFVTIGGDNPMMMLHNDGVVAIRSQKVHRRGFNYIEVDKNHFEVLLDPDVVKNIAQLLTKSFKS